MVMVHHPDPGYYRPQWLLVSWHENIRRRKIMETCFKTYDFDGWVTSGIDTKKFCENLVLGTNQLTSMNLLLSAPLFSRMTKVISEHYPKHFTKQISRKALSSWQPADQRSVHDLQHVRRRVHEHAGVCLLLERLDHQDSQAQVRHRGGGRPERLHLRKPCHQELRRGAGRRRRRVPDK